MKNKNFSKTLLSLSGAALSLLGNDMEAHAASLDNETKASYRFSNYKEADLDDVQRYDIKIQQFRLYKPIADEYSVSVNATFETMAGASPWYIEPGVDNKPIQRMSGATIREERQDISVSGSKLMDDLTVSIAVGHSSENDYDATYYKLSAEQELDDASVSVFGGLSQSNDSITPTQSDCCDRVSNEKKRSSGVYIGFSRVLNKNLLFSSSISYSKSSGFLSDPYKQAWTVNELGEGVRVNDSRPDEKTHSALSAKLRYHLGNELTLHTDYRYFRDSWEISSHTVSATLFETLSSRWLLSQELRYYNQTRAYFYAPYYNGTRKDGYHSSDYRLSPYGAISGRFKVVYDADKIKYHLAFEKYTSSGDLALKDVKIENPGLVDFMVISLGIDAIF